MPPLAAACGQGLWPTGTRAPGTLSQETGVAAARPVCPPRHTPPAPLPAPPTPVHRSRAAPSRPQPDGTALREARLPATVSTGATAKPFRPTALGPGTTSGTTRATRAWQRRAQSGHLAPSEKEPKLPTPASGEPRPRRAGRTPGGPGCGPAPRAAHARERQRRRGMRQPHGARRQAGARPCPDPPPPRRYLQEVLRHQGQDEVHSVQDDVGRGDGPARRSARLLPSEHLVWRDRDREAERGHR